VEGFYGVSIWAEVGDIDVGPYVRFRKKCGDARFRIPAFLSTLAESPVNDELAPFLEMTNSP